MAFSKEIYKSALEIKKESRNKAIASTERIKDELYSKIPRLSEIDAKLYEYGAKIAFTALSKNEAISINDVKSACEKLEMEKYDLLAKAGFRKTDLFPTYICRLCEDTGYKHGRLCKCVYNLAKRIAYDKLSVDMPLDECTFETFDLNFYPDKSDNSGTPPKTKMEQIYRLCKNYALNFDKNSSNLLFLGNTGLGKTHLSLAIAGEVLNKGYGVIYGPALNLLNNIEKEHFNRTADSADTLQSLLTCDLLIIDDLGTEFTTPFSVSNIYNIINTRLLSNNPTIINTNLSFKELENKYSARLSSRLIGNYTMRQFIGVDIRQQKQIMNLKKNK